jgi:hypothetical protein
MLKQTHIRGLLLITCVIATFASTGCRSVPGMKMFARQSEPSPEALAGTGPSTTYPAPPSASATPEAIASIAGGTAVPATVSKPGSITSPGTPVQVAGFNLQNANGSSGSAGPGSTNPELAGTNMSAAQANGVYGNAPYAAPAAKPESKPMGYSFGSTATPKSTATRGIEPAATPSYLPPKTSYALPNRSTPGASTTAAAVPSPAKPQYTTPPAAPTTFSMSSTTPAPSPKAATPSVASGFSFPGSDSNTASITASPAPMFSMPGVGSASAAIAAPIQQAAASAKSAFNMPAASSPDFSTAAVNAAPTPNSVVPVSGSTYMPGSTGKASGYPTGGESPTTSGSFFR